MAALAESARRGELGARIELVVSDVFGSPALTRARELGLEARHVDPGPSRFGLDGPAEAACLELLEHHRIDLVCLAGFMRILRPRFLSAYRGAVLNIHPSLLPAFPGLNAIGQALEYGVRVTGATVHFVTAEVDAGPVILQRTVPVEPDDDLESLGVRIHEAEHEIYPRAAALFCAGRLCIEGRKVRILQ
jgi:phosphoribosylglycinamide formyltransferase 1